MTNKKSKKQEESLTKDDINNIDNIDNGDKETESTTAKVSPPLKRRRGRPPGSTNKQTEERRRKQAESLRQRRKKCNTLLQLKVPKKEIEIVAKVVADLYKDILPVANKQQVDWHSDSTTSSARTKLLETKIELGLININHTKNTQGKVKKNKSRSKSNDESLTIQIRTDSGNINTNGPLRKVRDVDPETGKLLVESQHLIGGNDALEIDNFYDTVFGTESDQDVDMMLTETDPDLIAASPLTNPKLRFPEFFEPTTVSAKDNKSHLHSRWPMTTDLRCRHCTLHFDSIPLLRPDKMVEFGKKFMGPIAYCSSACVLGDISQSSELTESRRAQVRANLLKMMRIITHNNKLQLSEMNVAVPHTELLEYGGSMSRKQFRASLVSSQVKYVKSMPNLTGIASKVIRFDIVNGTNKPMQNSIGAESENMMNFREAKVVTGSRITDLGFNRNTDDIVVKRNKPNPGTEKIIQYLSVKH